LWQLVCDMTPEEFVRCIDFRYLSDALTRDQALEMLKSQEPTKAERIQLAKQNKAVPAYNTSVGWSGHSDEKVKELLREAADQGFRHFKLKVGVSGVEGDRKRIGLVREAVKDAVIMTDVNQLWDIDEAIEYMKQLADLDLWYDTDG
jgi:L-galactonate dehydratase